MHRLLKRALGGAEFTKFNRTMAEGSVPRHAAAHANLDVVRMRPEAQEIDGLGVDAHA